MGEPIFIRAAIRNDSGSQISVCCQDAALYLAANRIEILDEKQHEIECTRYGKFFEKEETGEYAYGDFSGGGFFWMTLYEVAELETCPLNTFYDLTLPGRYRITYYRRAVTAGQNIDPPLRSNTLEIEVEASAYRAATLGLGDFGEAFEEGESKTVSDMK